MANPEVRTSVSAGSYGAGYGGRSGCSRGAGAATTTTATNTAITRHSTGNSGSGSVGCAGDSSVNVRYARQGLCVLMLCEFEH